ncbi:ABC transporter substrate-binding protein [Novosphingobium taihuense]|uniref:Peptide/nickel transport system substrate-binding protein/oligopeptide transport system substrate-binding protein n=1 Tax=Novosphingobium taihuense TaxID=260085 RepID=A0A7W7ESG9_9SPHN|nr:ABC transporter substrate-binding protein [Novosphingobium taihuense]MBB4611791.1 peptide/nickel transport system substrate-binding protein/oligopeptide transport system substrate-binding protein [Novosphingobium taihuense]TWH88854.1 peptide/nickel transport system substrate-binding protein/oligopeptide transport system substrate-binding protein [Novosphingobium taihuense]
MSLRSAVIAAMTLALCACGKSRDGTLEIAVMGDSGALKEQGLRLSPAAQLVRSATHEGLVGFDEQGRVVPALADRWIVTDNGQSYIFRLRDGTWPDGKRITADAAAAALRKTIAGLNGRALGLDLAAIDEVRVMADRVIEIDLSAPVPELLTLLAQPELALTWRGKGTGPMVRGSDEEGAQVFTLIPPEQRGLPKQPDFTRRARKLAITFTTPDKAVTRFNDGYADVLLGGRIDTIPLAGSIGLTRGNVQLDPVIGLFGLMVDSTQGFLGASANREALAMAIDRDALIGRFNIGGWQPTTRVVSPDVEDDLGTIGERWQGMSMDERQTQAAARVAAWKSGGRGIPTLNIAMPGGPGSARVFDQLQVDFARIGLSIRRVGERDRADLRLIDVAARYGRATWFLNQLSCTVQKSVCSPVGDERVAEARKSADPAARAALLSEAEAEVTSANGFIPIARPLRWSMVRSGTPGFAANPWGWHPLPPMAWLPR